MSAAPLHPPPMRPAGAWLADGRPLPLELQRQSVIDAAARMRRGLFLYPAIWAVLFQLDGYASRHLAFVAGNGLALALLTLWRWHYNAGLPKRLERDLPGTRRWFTGISLAYNLYWGCLTAIVMADSDAPTLRWLMVICTVGITAGGTVVLSMDRTLSRALPLVLLGPTAAMSAWQGGSGWALAALTVVCFAYSVSLSRLVSEDYWARLLAQAELEKRAAELEAISRTDALTQVPNRRRFEEVLAEAWQQAGDAGEPLAVAMVDLDHFKRINDNCGHPFGDRCLQAAAQALGAALHRPEDRLARYGGEEFVVLMPATDEAGARVVAQRMLAQLCDTVVSHGRHTVRLSCSVGVSACVPAPGGSAERLVQAADSALYAAKQAGRGRVLCQAVPPQD